MTLKSNLKQYYLRFKFRNKAKIDKTAIIRNVIFEGHNTVMKSVILNNTFLGEGTYINEESKIYNTKLGRYCSIADNVSTVIGKHPTSEFISMFPAFYYDTTSQLGFTFHKGKPLYNCLQYPKGETKFNIVIGNDVWIGSHVLILGGVTIGDGAIIAAGAVVTKDVQPYSVVGGVPAKLIKYRFNEKEIQKLLKLQWWNFPIEKICINYKAFCSIDNFQNI